MPRFFVQNECIGNGRLTLTGKDAHHISNVLRMKPGDRLTVCDFNNTEYFCEILSCGSDAVEAAILSFAPSKNELPCPVTLYMALPKGDKMEWIIMKSVELGVTRIVPFSSDFTVVKLDDKGKEKKKQRWQAIARSAAEQCGRGRVPVVETPVAYKEALNEACNAQEKGEKVFLCYEREDTLSLRQLLAGELPSGVSFFVGAEGGFSEKEVDAAVSAGVPTVSLGARILRCETAPLYVLSCIGYTFGDSLPEA